MRAIVTGASGMLGGAVLGALLDTDVNVEGWSRATLVAPDGIRFHNRDLSESRAIELTELEMSGRPKIDLLVHCAAATDADLLETQRDYAQRVNAILPERLAKVAKAIDARFIHISTDAVYNGTRLGRRVEHEQPEPLSVYAATKLEGEGRVLAANPQALVIRTTMFGWTLPDHRPKFAEMILASLTQRKRLCLFADAIFSPLHVADLATVILMLAEINVSGVLNVGASAPISKANFGRMIAEVFGLDASLIQDVSLDSAENLVARRAKNTGLNVKLTEALIGRLPTVREGVERLYAETFDGSAEQLRGRRTYP